MTKKNKPLEDKADPKKNAGKYKRESYRKRPSISRSSARQTRSFEDNKGEKKPRFQKKPTSSFENNSPHKYGKKRKYAGSTEQKDARETDFSKKRRAKHSSRPSSFSERKKRYTEKERDRFPGERKREGTGSRWGRKRSFNREGGRFSFDKRKAEKKGQFPMPLNKYLAHAGICSRRKAVDHIRAGEVEVNKKKITEPGYKVQKGDRVFYRKELLELEEKPVYILLNKPKDCLTTTRDPKGRRTVMDYVKNATDARIYPVGRLDRNTSGLLLLTNDGDLAQQLAHPSGRVEKIYHVSLNKNLTNNHFEEILQKVELEDGPMHADALAWADTNDKSQVGIEIHSGRNRVVRRLFEHFGYEVKQLDRVVYAGLTKMNLSRGKWRKLSEKEVVKLKHFTLGRKTKKA